MGEAETSLVDRCGYCNRPKHTDGNKQDPERCQCPDACDSTDTGIRLGCVPSSAFSRSASFLPSAATLAETNIGLVEIVSVREKHGYFRKSIPRMPLPLAVFLCLVNLLLPGIGTFLSILAVLCGCPTEHGSKKRSCMINLLAAFLQLITAPIIVGWIWSILWGITFVNITVSKDMEENPSSML